MKKRQRGKKKQDAKAAGPPAPPHEFEAAPTAHPSHSEAQHANETKHPSLSDWMQVVITGLTLIGIVIGAAVWRDSRESARQATYANRPLIAVHDAPGDLALIPDSPQIHTITLINGGKSTAHDVRAITIIILCECPGEPKDSDFIPPRDSDTVGVLPPGQRFVVRFKENLTAADIASLQAGKAKLFAIGETRYSDDDGKKYRARHCHVYKKDLPRDSLAWSACRSNNFEEHL